MALPNDALVPFEGPQSGPKPNNHSKPSLFGLLRSFHAGSRKTRRR